MKLCVIGSTFAPRIFRKAWPQFGFEIVPKPQDAELVFISMDTKIEADGTRKQEGLRGAINDIFMRVTVPMILTSQVAPGFTRSLGMPIWHMAETLRIKDAMERALNPDYLVIGCPDGKTIPVEIMRFVHPFAAKGVSLIRCTWEEAEFSKIAVNMTLAAQVENTNRLAAAAKQIGAEWGRIKEILSHDKRIGPHSYLEPGDWKQSSHLLRDYVTLREIENG